MIENVINHKLYIGKTSKNPEERFNEHKRASKRGSNFHLHNSISKYGEENFDLIYLELTNSEKEANILEKKWIKRFDTFEGIGYNMIEGGKSLGSGENHPNYGCDLSDKHKRKLSKALTGREYSDDTLNKMSESSKGKDNSFYGKTHSKESKRKMSEYHSNKTLTEKHKKRISQSMKGDKNYFYNKSHSKETKKKISKSNRGNGNKLTEKEAQEVKWMALNTDLRQDKIGDKYNIDNSTVSRIKNNYDWKHVSGKKPDNFQIKE